MVTRHHLRHAGAAAPAPHPRFHAAVGGALCLDFVNTVGGRLSQPADGPADDFQDVIRSERLTAYEDLVDWATWTRALSRPSAQALRQEAASHPRKADAVHARALRLREAIYRLCKAAGEGWPAPADDLALLNRELQAALGHRRLVPADPPSSSRRRPPPVTPYAWAWSEDHHLDAMLWPIALSAADVLASDRLRRVGQCPAAGCGWLFVDTSRSGRRQWCDMAVCGNAEKVRRFRERQRTSARK